MTMNPTPTTRLEALQAANVLGTVRLAIVEGATTTQDLVDYQERLGSGPCAAVSMMAHDPFEAEVAMAISVVYGGIGQALTAIRREGAE
jgi:hypothetical protein